LHALPAQLMMIAPLTRMNITTTCKPFIETGQEAIVALRNASCALAEPGMFGPLSGDALVRSIGNADAIIADLDTFDADVFTRLPNLKLVARWGVGFDAVDVTAATEAGVLVSNTPGVLDETVADLAFALMLGVARQIHSGHANMLKNAWVKSWASDVHSKTLGLIGCGRIGMAVARRAKGFNMRVIAFDLFPNDKAKELGVEFKSLEEVLAQSDFVSLHAAVTDQSRGMIGADQLMRMKNSAFLINTARGALVDENALADALNRSVIAGAALDAYCVEPLPENSPLRSAENILLTPHIASLTTDNGRRISDAAAQSVLDFAAGRVPKNLINKDVLKHPALRARLVEGDR
jgi:phosphoglycerate dehydrogenase-like enzyme